MTWSALVLEKAPFFLLAAGASLITAPGAQRGAMSTFAETPLAARIGNATMAYFQYLSKTLWPTDLAAFYPYSKHQSAVIVAIIKAGLLAGLSIFIPVGGTAAAVSGDGVVLVSGNAGADDRFGAGRGAIHGGSLHVHTEHRPVRGDGLGG